MEILEPFYFINLITSAFIAVLFIQSGLDKIVDWKGNLSWLKGHFEKSPLKNNVPLALGLVTIIEMSAGILLGAACIVFLTFNVKLAMDIAVLGYTAAALGLTMLFAGQRLAKDYAGAASLVPYFILVILGLYFTQYLTL